MTPNSRQFDIVSTNQSLTKRAKYHTRLLKEFLRRWKNEYLLSLREVARTVHGSSVNKLRVGDLVVLKKESTSRAFWKVAEIIELIQSNDGIVRAARIRVLSSDGKRVTELRRPIQHLVPLELSVTSDPAVTGEMIPIEEDNVNNGSTEVNKDRTEQSTIGRRPRRTAAIIGELLRRETNS